MASQRDGVFGYSRFHALSGVTGLRPVHGRDARATGWCGLLALAGVLALTGCQNSGTGGGGGGATPSVQAATPADADYSLLRRGRGDMNFLVINGGEVTVYDVTADRVVASFEVPPQSMVRVSPKEGVWIGVNAATGGTQVIKGPLPEKNVRELRLSKR